MPRKPKVPSYRLHRASGQAVVTLGGRDHYLGKHDSPESHSEYKRLTSEWLAAGCSAIPDRTPDLEVNELLAAYWAHAQTYYPTDPPKQLDRIKRSLAPVTELYGTTRAREFGPVALTAVRAWMVEQGWCRKVVNQRVGCIRRAWKYAVSVEMVPAAVYEALLTVEDLREGRTTAPDHDDVGPAPEDALAVSIPRLPGPLADVANLQLLSAARPGEVLGLKACDLDRTGDIWIVRLDRHKTAYKGHRRMLLFGPRAQEILSRRLKSDDPAGDYYLFSPRDGVAEWRAKQRSQRKTPVQPSQIDRSKSKPKRAPGAHYTTGSYGQAVARACRAAGCEHWHPHQLRHNAGTRLRAEFGPELAMVILGHKNMDMTEIYALRDLEKAREAMRKVG